VTEEDDMGMETSRKVPGEWKITKGGQLGMIIKNSGERDPVADGIRTDYVLGQANSADLENFSDLADLDGEEEQTKLCCLRLICWSTLVGPQAYWMHI
jgi:hypothetical protein